MVILLESHPHSPFFSGWMFSGGGGYFHMYVYWVCTARETPIFNPGFRSGAYNFHKLPQKNPFRSITILLSSFFFFLFFFFLGGGRILRISEGGGSGCDCSTVSPICTWSRLGSIWCILFSSLHMPMIASGSIFATQTSWRRVAGPISIRIFPLPAIGTALSSARIMSVVDKFRIGFWLGAIWLNVLMLIIVVFAPVTLKPLKYTWIMMPSVSVLHNPATNSPGRTLVTAGPRPQKFARFRFPAVCLPIFLVWNLHEAASSSRAWVGHIRIGSVLISRSSSMFRTSRYCCDCPYLGLACSMGMDSSLCYCLDLVGELTCLALSWLPLLFLESCLLFWLRSSLQFSSLFLLVHPRFSHADDFGSFFASRQCERLLPPRLHPRLQRGM